MINEIGVYGEARLVKKKNKIKQSSFEVPWSVGKSFWLQTGVSLRWFNSTIHVQQFGKYIILTLATTYSQTHTQI